MTVYEGVDFGATNRFTFKVELAFIFVSLTFLVSFRTSETPSELTYGQRKSKPKRMPLSRIPDSFSARWRDVAKKWGECGSSGRESLEDKQECSRMAVSSLSTHLSCTI